jgi:large-conductance mechanosensitive channel
MKTNLIVSTIIGIILAFLMMYIAWEHNPQYEFHYEKTIHFGSLIIIGVSWFIASFIVIFLSILIINKILNVLHKNR